MSRAPVCVIPAGVPLDAAANMMLALGPCFPDRDLMIGNDESGSMVIFYDPAVRHEAKAVESNMSVTVGDDLHELVTFAMSADTEPREGLHAMSAWMKANLGDAANYLAWTIVDKPTGERHALWIQRLREGTKTPHEAREAAENRVGKVRDLVTEFAEWDHPCDQDRGDLTRAHGRVPIHELLAVLDA